MFIPRYESLKLNDDTKYLMTSEDAIEDPLMSVQFYIKSFFISYYSPSTVFIFIAKGYKSVFLQRYESLKLHHDRSYIVTFEDTIEDLLMCSVFYKEQELFNSCYSPSTVFFFIAKDT